MVQIRTGIGWRRAAWLAWLAAMVLLSGMAGAGASLASSPAGAFVPDEQGRRIISIDPRARSLSIAAIGDGQVLMRLPLAHEPSDLALDALRERVVVTHAKAGRITVVDLAAGVAAAEIAVGGGPQAVAVDPSRQLAVVANRQEDSVAIIDLQRSALVATLATGATPAGVAIHVPLGIAAVTNSKSDELTLIDLETRSISASWPVPERPSALVIDPVRNQAVIAHDKLNGVSIVDLSTGELLAFLPVGKTPIAVAIDGAASRVAVANQKDDSITVIDLPGRVALAHYPVGRGPLAVAFSPGDNGLHVLHDGDGAMARVDPGDAITRLVPAAGKDPLGIAIDTLRSNAIVANQKGDSISIIALPTGSLLGTVRVGRSPRAVAIDPVRDMAFIVLEKEDGVVMLDLSSHEIVARIATGRDPYGVAVDAAAGIAVVTNRKDDTLSVIETDTRRIRETLDVGRDPGEVAIEGEGGRIWLAVEKDDAVMVIDLAGGDRTLIPVGRKPSGIAVSSALGVAVVSNETVDRLAIIDMATLRVKDVVPVGKAPRGVALDDHSGLAFVAGRIDNKVTVVDVDSAEVIDHQPAGRQPEAVAADGAGRFVVVTNRVSDDVTIIPLPDLQPPEIVVDYPLDQQITASPGVMVSGSVSEPVLLTINGRPVELGDDLRFLHVVELEEGVNVVLVRAIDPGGNTDAVSLTVYLDTLPPSPPDDALVGVVESQAGAMMLVGEGGSVEAGATVNARNQRTGEAWETAADPFGRFSVEIDGMPGDSIVIVVVDSAGNHSMEMEIVIAAGSTLPPDPASVAPPLDHTASSGMLDMAGFLFSSTSPIQTGITAGAIDERRMAVLRGRIRDRTGHPVSGVTITIHRQPELGQTLSRVDGVFDLAVNGGGWLTVDYDKEGYLPVQRTIRAPWQDFSWLPEVVMIRVDDRVTTIDLSGASPWQFARGSEVIDADGARQATILIPEGARGEMVLPDGTTQVLTSMSFRASEYTVGDAGPLAMPGLLPPTSAYTYAVELSADEAIAVDAIQVRFDRPVYLYVENFPGFPVGGIVPAGWYDRERAAWVPADNGRIIEVVSVSDGIVEIDIDGTGAADAALLEAAGIGHEERRLLASLYHPGQSLWRVPVDHFTPWDLNWPYGPPEDAVPPALPPSRGDQRIENPRCKRGSVIECENSVVGKPIELTGSPFTLNYRSDRVFGRQAAYALDIPLSGATVPDSLRRIVLRIEIAGREYVQTFPAQSGQSYRFVWDGVDGYGRRINGARKARVQVGHVFPAVYYQPAEFGRSFAVAGAGPISAEPARQEITLWQISEHDIGLFEAKASGAGGWTLDVHHHYSPYGKLFNSGDGTWRSAGASGGVIETIAGNGLWAFSGDGGAAVDAQLAWPISLEVAADGGVHISDNFNHRIRLVGPDGNIRTIAGNGLVGFAGDGGPAVQARLTAPNGIALAADGSLYIADTGNSRIRRVDQNGTITTVAGNGIRGYSGDGMLATESALNVPQNVAVGADGSLYIADGNNYRIRRVGPDGIITTVAGTGVAGDSGDGGPGVLARIRTPQGLAIGPDGSLYIADRLNYRVRRLAPDGVITTVAGTGEAGTDGDGGPAIEARVFPVEIAVGNDGTLFITDGNRVRTVGRDGIINTLAGNGEFGFSGDGGPPAGARFGSASGIAMAPDGSILVADHDNNRVRRIGTSLGHELGDVFLVAARSGREHYLFDSRGRHLRTVDTATGVDIYRFDYDDRGRLERIIANDGMTYRLERDADDSAITFVTPYQQHSRLVLDAAGYLASVTNPAGEATLLDHDASGLLTAVESPSGRRSAYRYDAAGRLIETIDAAGGGWTLARDELDGGFETRVTSAEGRPNLYQVSRTSRGNLVRTYRAADASRQSLVVGTDGSLTLMAADGSRVTLEYDPDHRYQMMAPVPGLIETVTPAGLTDRIQIHRTAQLGDARDVTSHSILGETVTRNDRRYASEYLASIREWTQSSPQGRTMRTRLDALGRLSRQEMAWMAPASYDYDDAGRLTGFVLGTDAGQLRRFALGYDARGNLATLTDPLDRVTLLEYDAAGRVTHQASSDGRAVDYVYDEDGNLLSLLAPGGATHRFEYTPVDLEAVYLPPEAADGPAETRYRYNLDRQLTVVERPDGTMLTFDYDAAGRQVALSMPEGAYYYEYDTETGHVSRIAAPDGGALSFIRDGFLPMSETTTGAVGGTVSFGYDENFWVTSIALNGAAVSKGYDDDGLLTSAGTLSIGRDPGTGLPVSTTIGSITTSVAYNAFAEPVAWTASAGETKLAEVSFIRDAVGRIIHRTEHLAGSNHHESYSYDAGGRLVAVNRDGIVMTWGYDDNGNRMTLNGSPMAVHDEQDRLLSYAGASYTWTANGELATRTEAGATTEFGYDALGNLRYARLPGIFDVEYVIDARNRRSGKKVDGVLVQGFLYQDSLNPIAELDGDGRVVSRFVYADRPNVPAYMIRDGVAFRILSDHLGSPRLVVNSDSGEIVQRIDYDVWGNVLFDSNPGFQPFGFAGGLYDKHTGLVRFGARDYAPSIGRWTAKDPIRFQGMDANLYGYVLNDPVNYFDVDGEVPVPIVTAAVGAFVSGTAGALQASSNETSVIGGFARGFIVGGTTGFFGGAGFGIKSALKTHRVEGSGFGSVVSSIFGSFIGNTLAGIDIVTQAHAASCEGS